MKKYRHLFATFLLIGDSHTYQSFGRNLDSLLRSEPDAKIATYASWGSAPPKWFYASTYQPPFFSKDLDGSVVELLTAPTPNLPALLDRYHPDVTIIALGANLFSAPLDYSAKAVLQMAQTTTQFRSVCFWVGPPDSHVRSGRKMDELYGVLRGASASHCQFIDSREWTHYPASGGDGLHYDYLGEEGLQQTRLWAQRVYEQIKATLSRR